MSQITYTYKVVSWDIESATMTVRYNPDDDTLAPIRTNINLVIADYRTLLDENGELKYASQDDVPFSEHLEHTLKYWAPVEQWKRQKMMINGHQDLLNKM